jgi:beta-glucosidase
MLETETHDRPFDLPAAETNLVQSVAAVNKHTIVVINSGGSVAWAGWLDKVPAVLQAWYPGQSGGQAVAEIIFGDVNPSGRLPATFEKNFEDNPTSPYYHVRENKKRPGSDVTYPATPYTEGIFVGYRGYDEKKIEPQFAFGHGLSYTEFDFSHVQVSAKKIPSNGQVTVSVDVKNSGKKAGAEVVQLYVHDVKSSVKQPVKELKGFERVSLQPGEKKTVKIQLDANQLAYFDVNTHGWVVEPGEFDVLIGASSRDIRGKASFEVTK